MLRTLAVTAAALAAAGAADASSTYTETVGATAYCQGTRTASGLPPGPGIAAMNTVPLGTRITISPPAFGLRRYIVEDRIGWGTSLDLYTPSCSAAISYGRRLERIRILGR